MTNKRLIIIGATTASCDIVDQTSFPNPPHEISTPTGLMHGCEVESDDNCLFTVACEMRAACEVRIRTVRKFIEDVVSKSESAIRHMYSSNLNLGWDIYVVKEFKLLAMKQDREGLDSTIEELVQLGIQREIVVESIYKE
ncbi:hypothetical protein BUALT_Bualt06G0068600 [Buddleja alternifolia]|uniref:Uncharacterized protein n=1 Tax=Buddleja alternifolia TaxID=168488 RepID=A0AAV6XEU5_9LAMI|nr:hypothetical protein BUALT_Bualt06G0068600 [Buddleja alternifolia]